MSRPPPTPTSNAYRNVSDGTAPPPFASNNNYPPPQQVQQPHYPQHHHTQPPPARFATPPTHPPHTPPAAVPSPSQSAMSRAERFEDEKRRIIESCFAKLDPNGQLAESYITHIRIQEDAQYPSSPPPPDSPSDAKKPRLIIIAVRSTGRVRMHKARENTNGSFSIGKTWNLEELSAIESYSNSSVPPTSEREAQWRQWAGNTGFTVTITKPYYWQAGTGKEKDFFIASCIKIYRKYTKGQVPELKGFDERERAQMTGATPLQPGQQRLPSGPQLPLGQQIPATAGLRAASGSRGSPAPAPTPPQPPFAMEGRPQSRPGSVDRQSPGPPPFAADGSRQPNRMESPGKLNGGPRSPPGPRQFTSQERMRPMGSRDGLRQDHRPGTSPAPGPGGYQRSPLPPTQGQVATPSERSSQMQSRTESPAISRPHSPPSRQRVPQPPQHTNGSVDESALDSSRPPTSNGGANLFHSTRQRWTNGQQTPDQNQQPASRPISPPSAQQLPPIETSQPWQASADRATADAVAPQTATSDISTPGVDFADAAAVGALTSYWPPDPKSAATPSSPPPSQDQDVATPPRRSARRPTLDPHRSDDNHDLRPAPLSQKAKGAITSDGGSQYATPLERSAQATPSTEVPPEVKPLSIQNKSLDRAMEAGTAPMPGGFAPSPLGSPAATPIEERTESDAQRQNDEQYRPGLGPMIKKNQTRDRFRKAAAAANAFKPRPGGAAEKIMKAKAEREAGIVPEPDGISGVVPRPQPASREVSHAGDEPSAKNDDFAIKTPIGQEAPQLPQIRPQSKGAPKVEISSPDSPKKEFETPSMDGAAGIQLSDDVPPAQLLMTPQQDTRQRELDEAAERERQQKQIQQQQLKVKRRSNYQNVYLDELGVDRGLLEGKCLDFEALLEEFGWKDTALRPKQLSELETDLRREQGRLEAGSWLSADGNAAREDKVSQVEALLDKTIQECDELEGLLTLYSVELGSLNEDISFIEAQSQGLQVQSANQKLLHTELHGLIQTMSLGRSVMDPLRYGNLQDASGVEEVESSLVRLYQAMVTIDPSIRATAAGRPKSRSGLGAEGGNDLASMRAVREKRDGFERESNAFSQRLMQHLEGTFASSFNEAKTHVMRPLSSGLGTGTGHIVRINKDAFTDARKGLWIYSPLLLFVKELNPPAWQTIMRVYQGRAQPLYADAFAKNIAGWKKAVRKPADEEQLLFTYSEKDDPAAAGGGGSGSSMSLAAARKLTVKRSQTLAKTLRHAGGSDKHSSPEPRHALGAGTQLSASEAFAGAMDETAPLVSQEQNFVVDLFHASSLETRDFLDFVTASPIANRNGTNLMERKSVEPDRDMAKRVQVAVGEIFATSFGMEISKLVDWAVSTDPLQGVGVLACLTRHAFYLQDSSQEFLLQLAEQLIAKLQTRWSKFVDEQVKAIEDTKVKIKKRKGVIAFIKVFPHFSAAVENTFSAVAGMDYEQPAECVMDVRRSVDDAYSRINRAMFDSLKAIAKESPGTAAPSGLGLHPAAAARAAVGHGQEEQEEKEMLNYHILLIENMNHYIDEVDDGGKEGVLAEWRGRAMMERVEAMEAYVGRVMKRPLGKLIDFLDSAEALLTQHPTNPTSIAARPSYNRKAIRNILKNLDPSTVSKGIDNLRTRVRKHFGEAEHGPVTKPITQLVYRECERGYERTMDRTEELVKLVYPPTEGEKNADLEFSRADVQGWFKR